MSTMPGMLSSWDDAEGRRITRVMPVDAHATLLAFDDGTYLLAGEPLEDDATCETATRRARPFFEHFHPEVLGLPPVARKMADDDPRSAAGDADDAGSDPFGGPDPFGGSPSGLFDDATFIQPPEEEA